MKLHRALSYSLLAAGAMAAAQAVVKRWQWDETNIHAAIMLDWDDVQAVATRTVAETPVPAVDLLRQYQQAGATHVSIPELTLQRLLDRGELSVTQGAAAGRVYLQAHNEALAALVTTELATRLPHLQPRRTTAGTPLISFSGDLPTVAEVGLGFDPAQAGLVRQAGLSPAARPIGYSWVQPEMIERTLDQAAALGVKIVAFQGALIPGHEFKIQTTVEAMVRRRLTYAYFRESRHQKGDWFLAKHLVPEGLVVLAHEFEPAELLAEDWHTLAYRWGNLAVESGVRLCSVRFFRVLHAADPLESLAYVRELARVLKTARFVLGRPGAIDLSAYQLRREAATLAWAGLSTAGAAGLAADLLPVPDRLKLAGLGATALALTALPFLEQARAGHGHHHHRHDDHHHEHDHHHPHDHDHEHEHDHHHHHEPRSMTAYAPKGLALAATVAFPAATASPGEGGPLVALAQTLAVSAAGAAALTAITAEPDYVQGIEEYRGYNLDWLLPLGLAALPGILPSDSRFTPHHNSSLRLWRWLPLAGVLLVALRHFTAAGRAADPLAALDREHRHAHTHHLSAFQAALGDAQMRLSCRPLRKGAFLAPLGAVTAILLKRTGQAEASAAALIAAAGGQVAVLAGFRNGQRPVLKTLAGRAGSWALGALLALGVWLAAHLLARKE
ncbi:MAG: DUF5693 family protein [Chloroflexota bacterium]